ncbi:MAG: hypothetical protein KF785_09440 [Gemmatimonadales bacterium]|nr:hypothetical protein [Gemmatimonadales bacterium]
MRRGLFVLVVIVALFVVERLLDAWFDGFLTTYFGRPLWGLLRASVAMPIGVAGAILLAMLSVLLVLSWLETSPTYTSWAERRRQTAAEAASCLMRSELERRLMQDYRSCWLRFGRDAVDSMLRLFNFAVGRAKKGTPLVELLPAIGTDLEMRSQAFGRTVDDNSSVPIDEVRETFNKMYGVYLRIGKHVAELVDADVIQPHDGEYLELVSRWRSRHRAFFDRIEDLNQIPEHRGKVAAYLHPFVSDSTRLFFQQPSLNLPSFEEARQLDLVLRLLTPDEGAFLDLLRKDATSYSESDPDGDVLRHEVFVAGRQLASRGLFAQRDLGATIVFTVPRHIQEALEQHYGAPLNDEVRLRTDRIWGSGASGSGARSSQ